MSTTIIEPTVKKDEIISLDSLDSYEAIEGRQRAKMANSEEKNPSHELGSLVDKCGSPHIEISHEIADSEVKCNLALETNIGMLTDSFKVLKCQGFDESVNLEVDEPAFVRCHTPANMLAKSVNVGDNNFSNTSILGSENGEPLREILQETETRNIDSDEPPQENKLDVLGHSLEQLQCPFIWGFAHTDMIDNPEKVIMKMFEKKGKSEGDGMCMWQQVVLKLVLCYAYYNLQDMSQALKAAQDSKEAIQGLETPGMHEAVTHVVQACEVHLLVAMGQQNKAQDMMDSIIPYNKMSNMGKGAIYGLRGAMLLECGNNGTRAAVSYAEKALGYDPSLGEWHFMLGMSLARIRHIEDSLAVPQKRELLALEKAVEVSKMPAYMIFLAQSYSETVSKLLRVKSSIGMYPELQMKLREMNDRSAQLYRDTLALKPNCPYIKVRCAQGFLKLQPPHKDINLARECIDHSLLLMPNNIMANHVGGMVYSRLGMLDRAMEYYEFAGQLGAFGAHMDLALLRFRQDPHRDMMPDLTSYLEQYHKDPSYHIQVLLKMGAYQLYVNKDFLSALPYWMQVIQESPNIDKLKSFWFDFTNKTINIFEVIMQEAQQALRNGETGPALQEAVRVCSEHGFVMGEDRHRSNERIPGRDLRREGFRSQNRGEYSRVGHTDLNRNWRQ